MNNDDERDFDEERANAALGRDEEEPAPEPLPDNGMRQQEYAERGARSVGGQVVPVTLAICSLAKAVLFTGEKIAKELAGIRSNLQFMADHWNEQE